jgi:WD40 repeat protein
MNSYDILSSSLFDIPARNVISPPISIDSSNQSISLPIKKHRFDDRSQTRISLSLKSHSYTPTEPLKHQTTQPLSNEILNWTETSTVTNIINSSDFLMNHGSVVYVEPTPLYVAVGTSNGRIIGFHYHQGVEFILGIEDNEHHDKITCIAYSADATFIAAGYESGTIRIWDLSSKASGSGMIIPYFTILPITLKERFTKNSQAHLINTPISQISFVCDLHLELVSTDVSGLVFFHNGIKKFLNKYFISQKILGKNDANTVDAKFTIYDCQMLPLGTSHQITDQIGLMAVITNNVLVVVSILSLNNSGSVHLITHFKIGKSKNVSNSDSPVASLSWYPCMETSTGFENAKLVYSWNNVLTIAEVDNNSLPKNLNSVISELKDKDKAIPNVPIKKFCRWLTPNKSDKIVSVKWISSNIICAFVKDDSGTKELKLTALYYFKQDGVSRLVPVGYDNVLFLDILSSKLSHSSSRGNEISFETYQNSINCIKERVVTLVESDGLNKMFIGQLLNWADQLVHLVSNLEYARALTTANDFYNSTNTGQLVLVGLPDKKEPRRALIRPYLLQIMQESISFLFAPQSEEQEHYISVYFDIISLFSKDGMSTEIQQLLEAIFEQFENHDTFFEILESYTISESISSLPPIVLKKLVEYYARNDKGELLTEILCLLDIHTLDIDLTISLCKEYNLRDCLIYIWNYLLNDYQTPLVDFIQDFEDEDFRSGEDHLKAYAYMSYIFTGRQYPTDRFIDEPSSTNAKESICSILFSSSFIAWPPYGDSTYLQIGSDEIIFPYLYSLLKTNSFEMLSTLNEFFEDTYLNDDHHNKLNRQYIIEALLDIFEANHDSFNDSDRCQLAIFIGRNYPKYSQFLRLSESVLNGIIDDLCSNTVDDMNGDCELALQSLLPHYEPDDDEYLLEKLMVAKFYNVLINIYGTQGKHAQVLEVWLKQAANSSYEDFHNESLNLILERALVSTENPGERSNLIRVIKLNFERFASFDVENFVKLISRFHPSLHVEVINIEDPQLAYKYLMNLFDRTPRKKLEDITGIENLICRYIELLCTYKPQSVYDFIQEWLVILARKEEVYENTKTILKSHQDIHSLASMIVYQEEYSEGLKVILEYLNANVDKLSDGIVGKIDDNFDKFHDNVEKFTTLFNQSMEICEHPGTYKEESGDISLNEKLWLDLIRLFVSMADRMQLNTTIHELLNKCIHDCFRKISDTKLNPNSIDNKKKEQSFLTIFNKFLETSEDEYDHSQVATLANIRGILHEVFVSYSYESEMLNISLTMVNEEIYKSMDLLRIENVRGWDITNKSCASCGKAIWGPDISPQNYQAWEDRQRNVLLVQGSRFGAPFKDDKYHRLHVYLFKCEHGYHASCLENLGQKTVTSCVICNP